jgi:hypothetical protein
VASLKGRTFAGWIGANVKELFKGKPAATPADAHNVTVKTSGDNEYRFEDPVHAIGKMTKGMQAKITIDHPLYGGDYVVSQVRSVEQIHEDVYPFTDYMLTQVFSANRLVLRIFPKDLGGGEMEFDYVICRLHDELGADHKDFRDLMAALLEREDDNTGKFVEFDDESKDITATYWRAKGVHAPHGCKSVSFRPHGKGLAAARRHRLKLWDFSRETTTEGGNKVNEFVFVEQDAKTSYVEIYKGIEINPERISY